MSNGDNFTPPFKVEGSCIKFPQCVGNKIHLELVVSKYTGIRAKAARKNFTTDIEMHRLYDVLGLFRALRNDIFAFNNAMEDRAKLPSRDVDAIHRYSCFRLMQQAREFGVRLPNFGEGKIEVEGLSSLITTIEEQYADDISGARRLIGMGEVDFESLAEFFVPGKEVVDYGAATGVFGVPCAFRVRACHYTRGKTLFGEHRSFYVSLEFVVSVGERFAVVEYPQQISEFGGTRSILRGLCDFIYLNDDIKMQLELRGKVYSQIASTPTYMCHSAGCFFTAARSDGRKFTSSPGNRASGRIMIDTSASYSRGVHVGRGSGDACDAVVGVLKLCSRRREENDVEDNLDVLLLNSVPVEMQHRTWPTVAGFSFVAKAWGIAMVQGLSPVVFDSDAFGKLVLPKGRKRLIEALVLQSGESQQVDLIAGKGQGSIFLLHGPPGTGKTLTAESIAEVLHRPLYVVSMGELGVSPENLEERLQEIFDLCHPWEALVLIDEAEMLLEARSKNEIVRNAMVCVMLRLLEYYNGVLFLTSNRVESLDPAFQSRVQCALRYDPLDFPARRQIWLNLFDKAKISIDAINVEKLAEFEINGRQIKNSLQMALALSRCDGIALNHDHLMDTATITANFAAGLG